MVTAMSDVTPGAGGSDAPAGLTLDASALIAFERRRRSVLALLSEANRTSTPLRIPATALAHVARAPDRQVLLSRLLRAGHTTVVALDQPAAIAAGRLLAATGTSDIGDAHLVCTARHHGDVIVTQDVDDLAELLSDENGDPEASDVRLVAV